MITKFVEDNRNWSLVLAQVSFLCFSGLEVPRLPCQIFSVIIHYFYMVFFTWTGKVNYNIILTSPMVVASILYFISSVMEGYLISRNLLTPFDLRRSSVKLYLAVGYGGPALFSTILSVISLSSGHFSGMFPGKPEKTKS